jgi:hypothetical protein
VMGGGARIAPLGVAMSPKRRVRAEHGRARAAKTHLSIKITVSLSYEEKHEVIYGFVICALFYTICVYSL